MALCVKCGAQFGSQKELRGHKATCGNAAVIQSKGAEVTQSAIKAEHGILTASDIKAAKTKDSLVALAVSVGLSNKAAAEKWTVAQLKERLNESLPGDQTLAPENENATRDESDEDPAPDADKAPDDDTAPDADKAPDDDPDAEDTDLE